MASEGGHFLQYHEPEIVEILIIVSFFTFLSVAEWGSAKVIRAGVIGQIAIGIIYGQPLANILEHTWQETFIYLGYIGLILIIFEGGLTTRLDLLKANFLFSYLLLYLGYGYGAVETFIIGAALSATSLGTTFAVISGASKSVDLSQTHVGAVLVSAAVIDDVTGLVMSSVIHDLSSVSSGEGPSLGWLIGRPIVASAAMGILTPVLTKWFFAPMFRKYIERKFAKYDHLSNIILMVLVLSAFMSIAAYAGTSILFGAFLAGSFLTYLPSQHPEGPFMVLSREEGEREKHKSPTFVHTFECYCMDAQEYVLAPLFSRVLGLPFHFLDLWTGEAIWKGVLYSLLMLIAKFVVGLWILIAEAFFPPKEDAHITMQKAKEGRNGFGERGTDSAESELEQHEKNNSNAQDNHQNVAEHRNKMEQSHRMKTAWAPALLLGMAMIARGEIGLLIIEIGYNNTEYVSEAGFLTGVWAILLNTIVGPIAVGLLVKYKGKDIGKGSWGLIPSK